MKKIRITDWHRQRQSGIGGSDAAAVLGLNPYKSLVQVYLEKIGEYNKMVDNRFVYWGSKLEDMIAKEFQKQTQLKVRRNNFILQSRDYPFMMGDIDREGIDSEGNHFVLECKSTSNWNSKQWENEDDIPLPVTMQVVHYLIITNYSYGWVAVLIGGNDFRIKKIERDAELEKIIIEKESHFWKEYVEKKQLPPVDGTSASTDILNKMYPQAEAVSSINLKSENKQHIERRFQIVNEINTLKYEKDEIDNKLKQELQDNEVGILDNYRVSWKNITSNRFNAKQFKIDKPEMYEQYLKQSNYRKFDIREIKEGA